MNIDALRAQVVKMNDLSARRTEADNKVSALLVELIENLSRNPANQSERDVKSHLTKDDLLHLSSCIRKQHADDEEYKALDVAVLDTYRAKIAELPAMNERRALVYNAYDMWHKLWLEHVSIKHDPKRLTNPGGNLQKELAHEQRLKAVLLPKAIAAMKTVFDEWRLSHPDDPAVLIGGRCPVDAISAIVAEHKLELEAAKQAKAEARRTGLVAGGIRQRSQSPARLVARSSSFSRRAAPAGTPTRYVSSASKAVAPGSRIAAARRQPPPVFNAASASTSSIAAAAPLSARNGRPPLSVARPSTRADGENHPPK